jgi:hypothetical protein
MIRLIFLLLQARLKSLTLPGSETKLLKEVEWFFNQYDLREPEKQMLAVPACYIEFTDSDFSAGSGGQQYMPQNFRLHIVTLIGGLQQRVTPVPSGAMAHHQVVDAVYTGIQHFSGKASDVPELASLSNTAFDFQVLNACNRTNISPNNDGGHILTTILTFKALCFDPAAVKNYAKVAATLNISNTLM